MSVIVTGYDVALPVTLKKDGSTFAIDAGATIKASLISVDRNTVLIAPVTLNNSEQGTDLASSLIIVKFLSAATSLITTYEPAHIEIQVDDAGKTPWFVSVDIEKGTIS